MSAEGLTGDGAEWTFASARVQARLIDVRDHGLYCALYTDRAVMAMIGETMDTDAVDALFAKICRHNAEMPVRARFWRLSGIATDEPIGQFSITRDMADASAFELGQMLLPRWQGQGVALEVSRTVIPMLMRDRWALGVQSLYARHAPANARVVRIGETLGFSRGREGGEPLIGWRLERAEWMTRPVGQGATEHVPAQSAGASQEKKA